MTISTESSAFPASFTGYIIFLTESIDANLWLLRLLRLPSLRTGELALIDCSLNEDLKMLSRPFDGAGVLIYLLLFPFVEILPGVFFLLTRRLSRF